MSKKELTFKELLKKLIEAAEQYGISSANKKGSKGVNNKDVKKYEKKLIAKYETLKVKKDSWKEKYSDYIDENLKED